MSELKRDKVKYIRDRCKSAYTKGSACEICGATELLEFHHYSSMTAMLNKWLAKKKIKIETAEDIIACRDDFISEHYEQIYNETVTLCEKHHAQLHKIYTIKPSLATAKKQARWVQRQRDKHV